MFFRLMPKEEKGTTTLSKTTLSKITFQHNHAVQPAPPTFRIMTLSITTLSIESFGTIINKS
jgi:hypothetical protein